jgi:anti-sigma factor RsiW
MTCEDLTERLPEYWAGELSAAQRAELEEHLASCATCREEARALGELWQALGEVADVAPEARPVAPMAVPQVVPREPSPVIVRPTVRVSWRSRVTPVWQMAAALLIAVTGFAAGRSWPNASEQTAIAEMRGELHGMRQMVALSLLRQESASERLRGVTWSSSMEQPGAEVMTALVDTLRHDGNVNVRLAAIDALRAFATDNRAREALVGTLPAESSPLVQIALIDAVVALKERRAAEALKALASDSSVNGAVRVRARHGLRQLL